MAAASLIAGIAHETLELELFEPFGISGGSQAAARVVLVEVRLADGTRGLGEAAPLPAYNGERVEDVVRALDAARPLWVGRDARAWRLCCREIGDATASSPSARCALETALLDALARRAGLSLLHWFGGGGPVSAHAEPHVLESDVTIPIVPPAQAEAAAARWWARGFRALKIKVGAPGDLERVRAAHAGAPEAQLLLDANGGLTADAALALIDALGREGISVALFEQPVPALDWGGLARVAERVRVALDESVVDARSTLEAARRLGAPHVVNIKLMKSGIAEALDMVAVARTTGLSLMIGGMLESALAMTTSACFAAGQGGFEFVDLDTPLFINGSPLVGGFRWRGSQLDLSGIDAGHGVERALR